MCRRGEVAAFEGVVGKDLSNAVPDWAENELASEPQVSYTGATDMDSPSPDSGEEYPHTNTQQIRPMIAAAAHALLETSIATHLIAPNTASAASAASGSHWTTTD